MVHKGSILNIIVGVSLLLLFVAVVHQTSTLHQLQKRALRTEVLVSKRSAAKSPTSATPVVFPGAIYTRWGRTTCPDKLSKLVYKGIAAGTLGSYTGGGSNILCLPMDPIWGNFTTKVEDSMYIYGAEYQVEHYSSPAGLFSNVNLKRMTDNDVPCAVCQTLVPATIMMLPGRTKCYRGWTLEYFGYLMSERISSKGRSQFTCMDVAPEGDPAGFANQAGVLFYFVQSQCGSLTCPPYEDGKELTCAVCSQRHDI